MNRNKVELMGRLTRDPETRTSPGGLEIAEICLAINKRRKNAAGEMEEEATFIDVTLFDDKAILAKKYLRKGEPVMIDGSLRVDKWEDKQTGQKRNKMKVVGHQITFLGSAEKKPAESRPAPQAEPAPLPATAIEDDDIDEIPF